ncbi:hypothetical protein ROHU_034395 [Labeo rohita]|uniref:Uncharacterized protein n=1 Tax=Labeo rohita TaxID=84645 RepID=A0A498L5G0_LABRO|nr:hypothetical protein ROHU_034395 [Labeo rohita]
MDSMPVTVSSSAHGIAGVDWWLSVAPLQGYLLSRYWTEARSTSRWKSPEELSVNLNKGTSGKDVYAWHKKEGRESQIQAMLLLINSKAWNEYQKAGINFVEKNLNDGNNGWKIYLAYK